MSKHIFIVFECNKDYCIQEDVGQNEGEEKDVTKHKIQSAGFCCLEFRCDI